MTAKVTAKKAATKRPTATPAPDPAGIGVEVLRLTSVPDAPEERVPLFYIDDREYTIAKRPRMNVGLQFLHLRRTSGDESAVDYLLEALIGAEGYQALREYEALTADQFQRIVEVAMRLTLGALELPKD